MSDLNFNLGHNLEVILKHYYFESEFYYNSYFNSGER